MASGPNATVNTLVYSTKDQQADAYLRSNPRPSGCSLWKCDENDVYQVPAGEIFCRAPWGPRNEICPKLIKYNATNNLRLHLKQKHSDLSFDKGKKGSTRMEDQAVAREAFAQCYRAHLEYEKSIGESHFSPSKKLRKRKRDERNHEQARVREEAEQIASAGPSRVVKDCPVRKYKGAMRPNVTRMRAGCGFKPNQKCDHCVAASRDRCPDVSAQDWTNNGGCIILLNYRKPSNRVDDVEDEDENDDEEGSVE
ncbi:hypothetical protein EYC84_000142 [Monilinia fructicola]|uniref:Uncharacterized protein n=1 Tax=Monilinia fructicola TaxID=38448 RepID=A0A5M9JPX5_MONFR|nr:hypothetical protein EYC84_000142 [Monilinia fructicola]